MPLNARLEISEDLPYVSEKTRRLFAGHVLQTIAMHYWRVLSTKPKPLRGVCSTGQTPMY